jgi:hypothetical protein
MPIDDPISQLQVLDASDERQRILFSGRAKDFLRIVKISAKLFVPGAAVAAEAFEMAAEWMSRRPQENRNELIDVFVEELKYRGAQVDSLTASSEEHRRFMEHEMGGLLLDALQRAEEVRSKVRIAHLARILRHAAEAGPRDGSDYVEEMMRVAIDLTDRDVALLRDMEGAHPLRLARSENRYIKGSAISVWEGLNWKERGYSEQEVESICCKLQSFGLVSSLDLSRRRGTAASQKNGYEILQKGLDFVAYIRKRS